MAVGSHGNTANQTNEEDQSPNQEEGLPSDYEPHKVTKPPRERKKSIGGKESKKKKDSDKGSSSGSGKKKKKEKKKMEPLMSRRDRTNANNIRDPTLQQNKGKDEERSRLRHMQSTPEEVHSSEDEELETQHRRQRRNRQSSKPDANDSYSELDNTDQHDVVSTTQTMQCDSCKKRIAVEKSKQTDISRRKRNDNTRRNENSQRLKQSSEERRQERTIEKGRQDDPIGQENDDYLRNTNRRDQENQPSKVRHLKDDDNEAGSSKGAKQRRTTPQELSYRRDRGARSRGYDAPHGNSQTHRQSSMESRKSNDEWPHTPNWRRGSQTSYESDESESYGYEQHKVSKPRRGRNNAGGDKTKKYTAPLPPNTRDKSKTMRMKQQPERDSNNQFETQRKRYTNSRKPQNNGRRSEEKSRMRQTQPTTSQSYIDEDEQLETDGSMSSGYGHHKASKPPRQRKKSIGGKESKKKKDSDKGSSSGSGKKKKKKEKKMAPSPPNPRNTTKPLQMRQQRRSESSHDFETQRKRYTDSAKRHNNGQSDEKSRKRNMQPRNGHAVEGEQRKRVDSHHRQKRHQHEDEGVDYRGYVTDDEADPTGQRTAPVQQCACVYPTASRRSAETQKAGLFGGWKSNKKAVNKFNFTPADFSSTESETETESDDLHEDDVGQNVNAAFFEGVKQGLAQKKKAFKPEVDRRYGHAPVNRRREKESHKPIYDDLLINSKPFHYNSSVKSITGWTPMDDLTSDDEPNLNLPSHNQWTPTSHSQYWDHNPTSTISRRRSEPMPLVPSDRWGKMKSGISKWFSTVKHSFGRRSSSSLLEKEGWNVVPVGGYEEVPDGPLQISHVEARAVYAFHPQRKSMFMLPRFEPVVVTTDGKRLGERELSMIR